MKENLSVTRKYLVGLSFITLLTFNTKLLLYKSLKCTAYIIINIHACTAVDDNKCKSKNKNL